LSGRGNLADGGGFLRSAHNDGGIEGGLHVPDSLHNYLDCYPIFLTFGTSSARLDETATPLVESLSDSLQKRTIAVEVTGKWDIIRVDES